MESPKILLSLTPGAEENYLRAIRKAGGVGLTAALSAAEEECDALLLGGGGDLQPALYGAVNRGSRSIDPARDRRELVLFRRFFAAGKPVLGICRGLQLINVALGGTLRQDLQEGCAIHAYDYAADCDRIHRIRCRGILRQLWGETAEVNSAHHQAAERLGQGLALLAYSDDEVAEALCHRTKPVLALQFHPERMGPPGEALLAYFISLCRGGEL